MIRFAARRFAAALITAWVASIIAFVLFWTVPNVDPSYFLGGAVIYTRTARTVPRRRRDAKDESYDSGSRRGRLDDCRA